MMAIEDRLRGECEVERQSGIYSVPMVRTVQSECHYSLPSRNIPCSILDFHFHIKHLLKQNPILLSYLKVIPLAIARKENGKNKPTCKPSINQYTYLVSSYLSIYLIGDVGDQWTPCLPYLSMGMGITPIAQDAIRYRRAHHYPVLTSPPESFLSQHEKPISLIKKTRASKQAGSPIHFSESQAFNVFNVMRSSSAP